MYTENERKTRLKELREKKTEALLRKLEIEIGKIDELM